MLQDSFKKLNKNQPVQLHHVKAFISESDLNQDGKIDKKEFTVIIERSVGVQD